MSLFPLINAPDGLAEGTGFPLYREIDWNFQTNCPVWQGGNPVFVTGARAVLVWAWNAIHTERFAHDVFSSGYGPDFSGLLGQTYTEEVRRSEAIRVIRETLQINPYITDVTKVERWESSWIPSEGHEIRKDSGIFKHKISENYRGKASSI